MFDRLRQRHVYVAVACINSYSWPLLLCDLRKQQKHVSISAEIHVGRQQ